MKQLRNKLVVFFVVCLFFGTFGNFVLNLNFVIAESGAPDTNGETSGDWFIEYNDYIVRYNETITLNGNLTINSTGKLELNQVNLIMNST